MIDVIMTELRSMCDEDAFALYMIYTCQQFIHHPKLLNMIINKCEIYFLNVFFNNINRNQVKSL